MSENLKYSVDDTILDDPVIRKGIKIKGVTQFNRQENIKTLYSQKLSKEEKQLSLETFNDNGLNTFRVIMNGLEIGVLPEDCLNLFLSKKYDYELTNIHLGEMTVEYGRIIYFAKLYATFTPKSTVKEHHRKNTQYKICPVCGKENNSTSNYCYNCKIGLNIDISSRKKTLNELQSLSINLDKTNTENQHLQKELTKCETEISDLKSEIRSDKKTSKKIAAVAVIIAIITIIVSANIINVKDEKYNSLKEDYELISESKEYIPIKKYTHTIDKGDKIALTFSADTLFEDYVPEYNFSLFDSNNKIQANNLDYEVKKSVDKKYDQISIDVPEKINSGSYYFDISTSGYDLSLPLIIK